MIGNALTVRIGHGWQTLWSNSGSSRPCVGVHCSGNQIAAVRVLPGKPLPRIERAVHGSFAPLVGHAVQGFPGFQALLTDSIFEGARIVVSLSPEEYEVYANALPVGVPDQELKEALRWQLRESLPFPCEEANIDFARLPAQTVRTASAGNAFVIAARRLAVNTIVEKFFAKGLKVEAVEIPEFSQRNLISSQGDSISGFVSFAGATCLLTLQYQSELCFARRMNLPSGDIEPEHLADRIATNVHRSIELFARQSGAGEVANIVVGPHSHAALIANCLTEQTGAEVSLFAAEDLAQDAIRWLTDPVEVGGGRFDGTLCNAMLVAFGSAMRPAEAAGFERWLQQLRRPVSGEPVAGVKAATEAA